MNQVGDAKLKKYFELTESAFLLAKRAPKKLVTTHAREEFLDMIERYISDAHYFRKKGDIVTAFAALNYAHGWLDAGAWIGLWKVKDSRLFTVDS